MTFSYEIISIGGPLGLEGAAALGLDGAGLDGDGARGGEIGALAPAKFPPGLGGENGAFAPAKPPALGPLGAFKPDPPDEAAFAGGK